MSMIGRSRSMDDGRICRCRHMVMCWLGARDGRLCILLSLEGSALPDERIDGSVLCIGKSQLRRDIPFFRPENGERIVQTDQNITRTKVCFSVEARIEAKTGMDLVIGRCQDWQTRRLTNHHDVLDAHQCSVPVACRYPIRFSAPAHGCPPFFLFSHTDTSHPDSSFEAPILGTCMHWFIC